MTQPLNAVTDRLFQGSVPDPALSYDRFTMIVLCAQEQQPELPRFPRKIVRPAFDDTHEPTKEEIDRARNAASEVARELLAGGCVLVTCAAGLNRSGLVSGLALTMSTRLPADEIIAKIRAARGDMALCNRTFAAIVEQSAQLRDRLVAGKLDGKAKSPRAKGAAVPQRGRGEPRSEAREVFRRR